MKIGLVGEAPTDTKSIANLLSKKWNEGFTYFPLLDNISGSVLDSPKTKHLLQTQFQWEKPDLVVFIRDLDSLAGDREQELVRQKYFRENNSVVQKKGIFLLCIFEIEALLLADLDGLEAYFEGKIKLVKKPEEIINPKELLKANFKTYSEGQNAEVFETLNFEKVLEHPSFFKFIQEFEGAIAS